MLIEAHKPMKSLDGAVDSLFVIIQKSFRLRVNQQRAMKVSNQLTLRFTTWNIQWNWHKLIYPRIVFCQVPHDKILTIEPDITVDLKTRSNCYKEHEYYNIFII